MQCVFNTAALVLKAFRGNFGYLFFFYFPHVCVCTCGLHSMYMHAHVGVCACMCENVHAHVESPRLMLRIFHLILLRQGLWKTVTSLIWLVLLASSFF